MENFVGIKEMYDVNLRLNNPLEIGDKKYDTNESILSFSKIEIAQISESKKEVQARGGYHNSPLINWEIDREMSFGVTHGVLSPKSWSILSNSKLKKEQIKSVQMCETVKAIEEGEYCYVDLRFKPNACNCVVGAQPNPFNEPLPMGRRKELMLKPLPPSREKWIFVYDLETGKRIREFEIYENRIFLRERVREVCVDYTFSYIGENYKVEVGKRLFNGFMRLEGKMSAKDEKTGRVSTVLVEMPKIKLSSNLSMRLGSNYDSSVVSDFYFTGYLDDSQRRDEQVIMNIEFLDCELTGEYI